MKRLRFTLQPNCHVDVVMSDGQTKQVRDGEIIEVDDLAEPPVAVSTPVGYVERGQAEWDKD